jgi:hypothetical protein
MLLYSRSIFLLSRQNTVADLFENVFLGSCKEVDKLDRFIHALDEIREFEFPFIPELNIKSLKPRLRSYMTTSICSM